MTDTDLRLELELMVHKLMEYCKHNQEAKDRLNEIKDFIVLYGDLKAKEAVKEREKTHWLTAQDIINSNNNGFKEGAKEERTKILDIEIEYLELILSKLEHNLPKLPEVKYLRNNVKNKLEELKKSLGETK